MDIVFVTQDSLELFVIKKRENALLSVVHSITWSATMKIDAFVLLVLFAFLNKLIAKDMMGIIAQRLLMWNQLFSQFTEILKFNQNGLSIKLEEHWLFL